MNEKPPESRPTTPTDPFTIITALQRQISDQQHSLAQAIAAFKQARALTAMPTTRNETRILELVKPGSTTTYADIEKATGLTKSVIHTAVQKLAYARKIRLALEPGPGRRLTYVLRRPEDVVVASELPTPGAERQHSRTADRGAA